MFVRLLANNVGLVVVSLLACDEITLESICPSVGPVVGGGGEGMDLVHL